MKMKKFINDPANLTTELLEGFALANQDLVRLEEDNTVVNKALDQADRVTIVTQGGSGHEPAISGFVGEGMIDISVVGDIFAAPGPQPMDLGELCRNVYEMHKDRVQTGVVLILDNKDTSLIINEAFFI